MPCSVPIADERLTGTRAFAPFAAPACRDGSRSSSDLADSRRGDEYAGFWMRLLAWIIDSVIVAIGLAFTGPLFAIAERLDSDSSSTGFAVGVVRLIIVAAYYVVLTGVRGQTVDKMALGVRVVGRDGGVSGLGYAALREAVGKFISAIALFLGFLWIGWDSEKRGWHDKIAGTRVVKVRQRVGRP